MADKYTVCRMDGKMIPAHLSRMGRPVKAKMFRTMRDAVNYIEWLKDKDPTGVFNGEYSIDGPEELLVNIVKERMLLT